MLNHTYTSVKNANLVDCGKKQHIPSQPTPLLKENFLGEFRTELDKKKVLAALGIASNLSLEWGNIQGDVGDSITLMQELDVRTKYTSSLDGVLKTISEGIQYLESIVGKDQESEQNQNIHILTLENSLKELQQSLVTLQTYLNDSIEVDINKLQNDLNIITENVNNITSLIKVSDQEGNALSLLDGDNPGLYVPDLSIRVETAEDTINSLKEDVENISNDLDSFVKREEFGDGDLKFVTQSAFDVFSTTVNQGLDNLEKSLEKTVKTGEDGHVNNLYVNQLSKDNEGNIQITDSFEVTSGIPIDIRFVKETLDDLLALPVSVCYEGMGVIVNSLSALYILRKPINGILTQEYVSDLNNWKCPEDLVTVAMTLSEYENLSEKNPNVFYYIYEDEITRTQEPNRADFPDDDSFNVAWQEWVNSLKTLSQEYMSASWGIDIESKLGQKASTESLNLLIEEINNIKGNGTGPSLESLGQSITNLQTKDSEITSRIDGILQNTEDGEFGRLVDAEEEISEVRTQLSNCVTKDELQDESKEFIFVKTSTYTSDKQNFQDSLSEQLQTKQLTATNISTEGFTIGDVSISTNLGTLLVGNSSVAFTSDLPKIEVLTREQYESKKDQLEDDVYYYVYEDETTLATRQELQEAKNKISDLEIMLKYNKINEVEYHKEKNDILGKPWVAIKTNYDENNNPDNLEIEVVYNKTFIKNMKRKGYSGEEEDIVEQWLKLFFIANLEEEDFSLLDNENQKEYFTRTKLNDNTTIII